MDGDLTREIKTVDFSFLFQDSYACFHVRRLQICDEAPFEAVAQALLQPGDILRHSVGGEDDLSMGFVKGVECMKEFFLGALAVCQKLHVVDDENVDLSKCGFELVHPVASKRRDELGHESFGTQISDAGFRIRFEHSVSNCVCEMGLAKTDAAVEKQWVIVLSRLCSDGFAGRVCKLIACADDERGERVARYESTEANWTPSSEWGFTRKQFALDPRCRYNGDAARPTDLSHRFLKASRVV